MMESELLLILLCGVSQSVRRKGYVYIICDKNPKHKQRWVVFFFPLTSDGE